MVDAGNAPAKETIWIVKAGDHLGVTAACGPALRYSSSVYTSLVSIVTRVFIFFITVRKREEKKKKIQRSSLATMRE